MTPALEALTARVRSDLACIRYPVHDWVPPTAGPDGLRALDVLVVGAGQCGLATTFALALERVDNVLVVDRAPRGREGPWITFARMNTLRTPKHLIGPDMGIPSLTPRAWYEASFGTAAWEALTRFPREVWMAYLDWYRDVLALPVRNETTVECIEGVRHGGRWLLRVSMRGPGGVETVHARRVVLATGMDGSGRWETPAFVRDAVPPHLRAHTADAVDFGALAGKRVGVLGAGASAFDNAATALEHGAARVDLFFRRARLPTVNPNRWMEKAGVLAHWGDMDDLMRWRFLRHFFVVNQPPPQDTFERCTMHSNFALHAEAPWLEVAERRGEVRVRTPRGEHAFDFVVAGTGYVVDLGMRADHGGFAQDVARWSDRFEPPADEAYPALLAYPYLGPGFEYTERVPGAKPWIGQIHNFTWGSHLSHGISGGAISPMKYALRRLQSAITRSLYLEDVERHYRSLREYDEPELVAPAYANLLQPQR